MKDFWFKGLPIAISLVSLIWGATTFLITQKVSAHRPYLEYQLEVYKKTANVIVTLATSSNPAIVALARDQFCHLYYGELAMVESAKVDQAMVKFVTAMGGTSEVCLRHEKQVYASQTQRTLALSLSHSLRNSLAESWQIEDWQYVPKTLPGTTDANKESAQ